MKFDVVEIVDQEDGSAKMIIDMDNETMVAFAKIGILHTLEKAAEKAIKENS
jgi:hypothetical protein